MNIICDLEVKRLWTMSPGTICNYQYTIVYLGLYITQDFARVPCYHTIPHQTELSSWLLPIGERTKWIGNYRHRQSINQSIDQPNNSSSNQDHVDCAARSIPAGAWWSMDVAFWLKKHGQSSWLLDYCNRSTLISSDDALTTITWLV